jgi:hypothetical protein
MRERLHVGAFGLALIALLCASRPTFAATPDTNPGFFTYVEPTSHLTSEVSVLPDNSFGDCNQTCRTSAKATKDWCIAHPQYSIPAIAAAAAAAFSASAEVCTQFKSGYGILCRIGARAAAAAAGAVATMNYKSTCAATAEVHYGACMCGCLNNCGQNESRVNEHVQF